MLLRCLTVGVLAFAGICAVLDTDERATQRDEHRQPRIPKHRSRCDKQTWDGVPAPPNAAIRRSFDGEWAAGESGRELEVLLLDGIGDCTPKPGADTAGWAIELVAYFGDDLFDFLVWNDDEASLWTASFGDNEDTVRVWRAVPCLRGFPRPPFVLRRRRTATAQCKPDR